MKRLAACTLAALASLTSVLPVAADAQSFGRLFSTPAERAALDRARERYDPTRQEIIVKPGEVLAPEVEAPPPRLPELMVNGLVQRSGGRSAAWINGTQLQAGEATESGIVVEARDGSVRFVLPDGKDTSAIKPGQVLDPNAGQVKDSFSYTAPPVRAKPPG